MYKLGQNSIIRNDGAVIPLDERNADYQVYMAWVAAGNVPQQADATAPFIPFSVSRFQARAALHLAGLLDDVEALMAAPDTPALAKLAWADAQEFKRNSPTMLAMAAELGLTETQLDELFTVAAGIEA